MLQGSLEMGCSLVTAWEQSLSKMLIVMTVIVVMALKAVLTEAASMVRPSIAWMEIHVRRMIAIHCRVANLNPLQARVMTEVPAPSVTGVLGGIAWAVSASVARITTAVPSTHVTLNWDALMSRFPKVTRVTTRMPARSERVA